jgi:lipid II:glycine glycyltransferase (peptidoglycan interpeptide bridge formation enzyme)
MLEKLIGSEEETYSQDDAEWDAFVDSHPHGSLLQKTDWARLKNQFGWKSHRVWLRRDGKLAAGAQVLVRSAALGLLRVAYIPHGPLVDWEDEEQVSVLINQIDFAAYEHRAGLLKMEPLIWQQDNTAADWEGLCQKQGCITNTDTIQPPQTLVIDLKPSLEEILAAMKQKTRYNIRLASKKGISVRKGAAEDMSVFNHLIQLTSERNEFGVHEPNYYQTAYDLFAPEDVALWMAEFEGRPLSAVMVFKSGNRAAYLYGASSNEERQRMPTYAVQWAAIQWAKEAGCTEYDLWGVPDYPKEALEAKFKERHDGLWGVYRFKRGFGGELKRTVGAADRVYNKLVYWIYRRRRGLS